MALPARQMEWWSGTDQGLGWREQADPSDALGGMGLVLGEEHVP